MEIVFVRLVEQPHITLVARAAPVVIGAQRYTPDFGNTTWP